MGENKGAPTTLSDRESSNSRAANLSLTREIAESFRRVRGDESYDGQGMRTIWHQGKMRTELLSWEHQGGELTRQELCFLGMVVLFKQGKPLQTGKLPADDRSTGLGRPTADLVRPDPTPSAEILEYASHLLKNIPERDFYAQHLLKQVNDTVSAYGFDESKTLISDMVGYDRNERPAGRSEPTQKVDVHKKSGGRAVALTLLALAGVLLGLAIGFFLW